MDRSPLVFGLFLQSSMILALGAQNLFVLEKGLLKDRPFLVASICSICDISLIILGVLGAGSFFAKNEWLSMSLRIVGALFLLKYAYDKYNEARKEQTDSLSFNIKASGLYPLILSTLAVSLLNPHVYLDTVVLIGGYSTKFSSFNDKLNFAFGAGLFSMLWFFSISFGSSFFSKALSKPKTMKWINYGAAIIMSYLALNLLISI